MELIDANYSGSEALTSGCEYKMVNLTLARPPTYNKGSEDPDFLAILMRFGMTHAEARKFWHAVQSNCSANYPYRVILVLDTKKCSAELISEDEKGKQYSWPFEACNECELHPSLEAFG